MGFANVTRISNARELFRKVCEMSDVKARKVGAQAIDGNSDGSLVFDAMHKHGARGNFCRQR